MDKNISRIVLTATVLLTGPVVASELPGPGYRWPLEIPPDELRQITASLLDRYPELAGSPGVKAAYLSERDGERSGSVFYYPHKESGGIKEAYRAMCDWQASDQSWVCGYVYPRRYLQLATQDYEVRLHRDVPPEHAVSIIQAAERDMRTSMPVDTDVPEVVLRVSPNWDDGYRVGFSDAQGQSSVIMLARLRDGGSASDPDDWRATVLSTEADRNAKWLVDTGFGGRVPGLVTITPYFEGGTFGGYRISPGSDVEQFDSLGLEQGDLLTHIDGVAVPPASIMLSKRLEALQDGETIDITIVRGPDREEMEIGLRLAPY